LFVNNEPCKEIEELVLTSWPHEPGNPRELLEDSVNGEITRLIEAYKNIVVKAILECIGYDKQSSGAS